MNCCSTYLVFSRRYATCVCSVAFGRRRTPRPGKAARICTFVDECCCHVARCTFLVFSRRYAMHVGSIAFVRRRIPRPGKGTRICRPPTFVDGCCHVARFRLLSSLYKPQSIIFFYCMCYHFNCRPVIKLS